MYHLCKQSRLYGGQPYCGPTTENMPMAFKHLVVAQEAARLMQERNPVGWNIFDSETQELVQGLDFHKEGV